MIRRIRNTHLNTLRQSEHFPLQRQRRRKSACWLMYSTFGIVSFFSFRSSPVWPICVQSLCGRTMCNYSDGTVGFSRTLRCFGNNKISIGEWICFFRLFFGWLAREEAAVVEHCCCCHRYRCSCTDIVCCRRLIDMTHTDVSGHSETHSQCGVCLWLAFGLHSSLKISRKSYKSYVSLKEN